MFTLFGMLGFLSLKLDGRRVSIHFRCVSTGKLKPFLKRRAPNVKLGFEYFFVMAHKFSSLLLLLEVYKRMLSF